MASAATVSSPNPLAAAKVRAAKRPRHEEEFEKNVRAAEKMYIRMYLPSEVHLARRVGCSGQKIKYVSAPVTPGCPTLEVGAQLGMLESSLNDRIRVRALPANDPHGPFGAFAGRTSRRETRSGCDWRAFGPQTQRVVAALVKDTTCVLVGKRYEDSRGNCVEKIPELKPRLGRPEEWLAQPDGPTSAPVFTRCVAIGRTSDWCP
eukprot:jgi/Mesvir1/27049/Mv20745-RA.1